MLGDGVPSLPVTEVLEVVRTYHEAMVSADTAQLDAVLEPTYSLVHITGYVQPKDEWLRVVRSGEFNYHKIEIDHRFLNVDTDDFKAVLTGRGIFNATIQGMHAPWRLSFRLELKKQDDVWMIARARYQAF